MVNVSFLVVRVFFRICEKHAEFFFAKKIWTWNKFMEKKTSPRNDDGSSMIHLFHGAPSFSRDTFSEMQEKVYIPGKQDIATSWIGKYIYNWIFQLAIGEFTGV